MIHNEALDGCGPNTTWSFDQPKWGFDPRTWGNSIRNQTLQKITTVDVWQM